MLNNRQEVIDSFKTSIFPYIDGFQIKEKSEEELEEESEEKKLEIIKDDFQQFIKYIGNESKGIDYDFFKDYFNYVVFSALAIKLCETKIRKKNNKLREEIKSRLTNLKDPIKK